MTPVHARPILDRVPRFDDRSKSFGLAPMLSGTALTKTIWQLPTWLPLDQGREGACVGFGWSAELAVAPVEIPVSNTSALGVYRNAQRIDRAEGHDFGEGASVLAGAKAVKASRQISSYRWAFGTAQVLAALVEHGPVVLGIPWYDSMYETDARGRVTVNGPMVGGHCILAFGFIPASDPLAIKLGGGDLVVWINSWGLVYGLKGVGFIRVSDLDMLLHQDGESVTAMDRTPRKLPNTRIERMIAAIRH